MRSQKLKDIQERLENYREAETAILASQEYSINGRTMKRADLRAVQDTIKDLEKQRDRLMRRGVSYGVPRG